MKNSEGSSRISWKWLLLLGSVTALGPLSTDSYLAAFPAMREEFGVHGAAVQATLTTYLIGAALGPLIIGPVSDAVGRRRPFLIALLAFVAASFVAASTTGVAALVVARLVQGFFGMSASVLSQAVLRDLTPDADLLRAMSRVRLVSLSSPIIAPSLGVLALRFTGWRGIFVGTGLLALVLAMVVAAVPADRFRGAVQERDGIVRHSVQSYRTLLADPRVRFGNIAAACTFAALLLYISNGSLIFHDAFGVQPSQFGLIFTANAVCMLIGSQLVPMLADRLGAHRLYLRAVMIGVVGVSTMLVSSMVGERGVREYFVGLAISVFSTGVALALPTKEVMELHPERAGAGAGLLRTGNMLLSSAAGLLLGFAATSSGIPLAVGMLAFQGAALWAWTRRGRHVAAMA